MKGLRQSDSVSVSEVAERSVFDNADDESGFPNDSNATNGCQNNSNPNFDPNLSQNEASQLNEEDIFRMKSLSISRADAMSEQAGQSALSQVDSASNFEEHVNQVCCCINYHIFISTILG